MFKKQYQIKKLILIRLSDHKTPTKSTFHLKWDQDRKGLYKYVLISSIHLSQRAVTQVRNFAHGPLVCLQVFFHNLGQWEGGPSLPHCGRGC